MAVRVHQRLGTPSVPDTELSTSSTPPPPVTAPTPFPPVSRPGPSGPGWKAIAIVAVVIAAVVLIPLALHPHPSTTGSLPSPSSIPTSTPASSPVHLDTGTPAGWVSESDGSSYQVDVMHDGDAGDVHLRANVSRAWTRDWLRIGGAPVIGDGLLFAGVVPVGHESRTDVVAMRLGTGAPVWHHDIGARTASFALDHGRLFALAMDGTLWAFDAATGDVIWQVQMPEALWYTAPTAAGSVLHISGNGTLYAVDEENGAIVWSQGVAGDTSVPTLFGTSVVAGYACFQVPTFDVVTGTARWNHTADCSGGGGLPSAYYDGRIYARSGSEGLVLDASDGSEVGRFTSDHSPAFHDGTGYFVDGGVLQARDLGSLDVVWSVGTAGDFVCAPIVVGDTIYIGDRSGELVAIDQSGHLLRRLPLTPPKLPTSDVGPVALNAGDGAVVVATMSRIAVFH